MQSVLYIGTYSVRGSAGLYRARLDTASGALGGLEPVAALPNPTFQVMHPSGRFLFSVSEDRHDGQRHNGSISTFAVETRTGRLSEVGRVSARGDGPCHLCLDAAARYLFVANYASGSAAAFPVAGDGRLCDPTAVVQHRGGSGIVPERQEGPHAHSVTIAPDNRFTWVADLGLDRIFAYAFDAADGSLTPHDPPWVACAPGSGPRHMAIHPSGRYVFLAHELNNTLTVFRHDADRGVLTPRQTLSLLPPAWVGASSAADIHVAPDGRHVYASNRGHDSLALFAFDPAQGDLRPGGHVSVGGRWPRNFLLTPEGTLLLAANQESDSITVFRVDPTTGALHPRGDPFPVPAPVCLTLLAC